MQDEANIYSAPEGPRSGRIYWVIWSIGAVVLVLIGCTSLLMGRKQARKAAEMPKTEEPAEISSISQPDAAQQHAPVRRKSKAVPHEIELPEKEEIVEVPQPIEVPTAPAQGVVWSKKALVVNRVLVGPLYTQMCRIAIQTPNGVVLSKDSFLRITMSIFNVQEGRLFDYHSWHGELYGQRNRTVLRDDLGNSYDRIDFGKGNEIVGHVHSQALRENDEARDALVYEMPVEAAKTLYLELHGEIVGSDNWLRFEIDLKGVQRPMEMLSSPKPEPTNRPLMPYREVPRPTVTFEGSRAGNMGYPGGRTIHIGPEGGRYHYSKSGNKVYEKR